MNGAYTLDAVEKLKADLSRSLAERTALARENAELKEKIEQLTLRCKASRATAEDFAALIGPERDRAWNEAVDACASIAEGRRDWEMRETDPPHIVAAWRKTLDGKTLPNGRASAAWDIAWAIRKLARPAPAEAEEPDFNAPQDVPGWARLMATGAKVEEPAPVPRGEDMFACGGCEAVPAKSDEDRCCASCGATLVVVDGSGRVTFGNLADSLRAELEKAHVQLAGCSVAALGGATGSNDAKKGDYGWSVAFEDVKGLRAELEKAKESLAYVQRLPELDWARAGARIAQAAASAARTGHQTAGKEMIETLDMAKTYVSRVLACAEKSEAALAEARKEIERLREALTAHGTWKGVAQTAKVDLQQTHERHQSALHALDAAKADLARVRAQNERMREALKAPHVRAHLPCLACESWLTYFVEPALADAPEPKESGSAPHGEMLAADRLKLAAKVREACLDLAQEHACNGGRLRCYCKPEIVNAIRAIDLSALIAEEKQDV